ncbi:hypothetical protein GALMADRAFT_231829 [Galerina marginata CBS 339.88]|uniref:DH domain-containing protein n=1 Tax=Galerina marginata (strain CBS 339.88) TaxID=685588 RepID=A0A067SIU7_GALM3|nr:hypothetical protein GALMADRAFT_231829 [Galerina marginata CBS 339.88]
MKHNENEIQIFSSSPIKISTANNTNLAIGPPNLSPLLLAHFPYLSLYTPFVTAFPSTMSALNELIMPPTASSSSSSSSAAAQRPTQYNPRFAAFLATQEADPRCGKFKLRDWLLTIVQRCPRYLMLLTDLVNSTAKDDPEHVQLMAVHTLVAKITLSLNTSLHTHAQTLSLLALQKSTPNLPFQLISPGRTLLKRGPLLQVERSGDPIEREFLLFSDCMIWLAPVESSSGLGMGLGSKWSWSGSGSGASQSQSSHNTPVANSKRASAAPATAIVPMERPPMMRSRSKSEAELSTLKMEAIASSQAHSPPSPPSARTSTPVTPPRRPPPAPNMAKRHASSDDRWTYKGRVELVDVQVVVGHAHALALGGRRRGEGGER